MWRCGCWFIIHHRAPTPPHSKSRRTIRHQSPVTSHQSPVTSHDVGILCRCSIFSVRRVSGVQLMRSCPLIVSKSARGGLTRRLSSSKSKIVASNGSWDYFLPAACACFSMGTVYYVTNYTMEVAALKRKAEIGKSVGQKVPVGGPFSLFDQHGEPVTDATFLGQYVLLYFGFTFCPDICPNEINKLTDVLNKIVKKRPKRATPITPVFVTVDPYRDTIGQLRYYSGDFDSRFRWLTGTPSQVAATLKDFRVYTGTVDEDLEDSSGEQEDYLVDHSSYVYLLGPDGQCLAFYGKGQEMEDMVESIQLHMEAFDSAAAKQQH